MKGVREQKRKEDIFIFMIIRATAKAHGFFFNSHKHPETAETRIANSTHHLHGVGQIALDFVKHVFAAAAQEDGAGLGVRAFGQERKVLVPQLFHLLDIEGKRNGDK